MAYELLRAAVQSCSALQFVTILRADGGGAPRADGTREPSIVAPATYAKNDGASNNEGAGPRINVLRLRDRIEVRTVLNSIAAEGHRLQAALRDALDEDPENRFPYPRVRVKGTDWEIDGFDMPHRATDGYLRFTDEWATWYPCKMTANELDLRDNLTLLYQRAPASLLFGLWNSYEQVAGRIPRAMSSTIDGITLFAPDAEVTDESVRVNWKSQRVDPLIKGKQLEWPGETTKRAKPKKGQQRAADANGEAKKPNVSSFGLGDIPARDFTARVWIDYAVANTVIHLAALRRYRFPINQKRAPERDLAARTVIAALGILAHELAVQRGYFLRSGCALVPSSADGSAQRLLVASDGSAKPLPWERSDPSERVAIARKIYMDAVEAATKHELSFDGDRVLTASPDLNKAVALSNRLKEEDASDGKATTTTATTPDGA